MSLLGLHREHPHNPSTAYTSSSTTHINRIHPGERLASHMDERDRPSSSRKRHRSDEITGSSFRLPQSSPAPLASNSRMRTVGNTTQPDHEPAIPPPSDPHTLEPLHPRINFSAISHGTQSPSSLPSSNANTTTTPSTFNYSTTLPLPNPGRAHRFCQVCEQINHVRRKLCTKCGAPKPSAVRNAVGVRPISEVDSTADRRQQGDTTFRSDYTQSHIPTPSLHFDAQNRFNSQSLGQSDTRYPRQIEHTSYQARPLSMRSAGDDIPLYSNTSSRPSQPGYPLPETHAARRIRTGSGILASPLLTFSSPLGNDYKFSPAPHKPYGNTTDLQPKPFPSQGIDREHFQLPSSQETPGSLQNRNTASGTSHRTFSKPPLLSSMGVRNTNHVPDEGLSDDILALSRPSMSFDTRQNNNTRRFPTTHGLRQYPNDQSQGQTYGGVGGAGDSQGILYRPSQELFQQQQQPLLRQDDRGHLLNHDASRGQKYPQSLSVSPGGDDRDYHAPQLGVQRGQPVNILAEHHQHPSFRRGLEDDRTRQLSIESRGEQSNYRQMHKNDDYVHVNASQFDEPNRSHDDGRLGLDSILMQQKNSGHND